VSSVGDNAELKNVNQGGRLERYPHHRARQRDHPDYQRRVMSQLIDDDKVGRKLDGLLGIQLHKTPNPMKIESRNIRLKDL